MVLVSYILVKYFSVLQTKLSYRERHEARCVRLQAMPLDQHIEGGHGERQPGLEIGPHAVHDLLEMADERHHRRYGPPQDSVPPPPALTQFQVGRIALRGMEAGITQDNHLFFELPNEP